MAEGGGVEPPSGSFRSAGFRDQKALPSLRALRWSGSRDSNPVRTVLQTVASTASASPTWHTREELTPEPQSWRLLPFPSGRVRGTPGRIRTCMLPLVLSEPRLPIPPRERNWWAGGDSNSHAAASRSERDVSTKFHHRPVSRAGLEPAKLRSSTAGVCRLRHLDVLVRAVELEPT